MGTPRFPRTSGSIPGCAGPCDILSRLVPILDRQELERSPLADLHARGIRVAGAEAGAPLTARESDLRGPLAIVVGSEGQGLGAAVRRRCDLLVRIPMSGRTDSLNAASALAVGLFAYATRPPR